MDNEIVAAGARRLAAETDRSRAAAEADAIATLSQVSPAILSFLTTIAGRLELVERELAATKQMVMATRIRRPHRDVNGQIDYVVDELVPPAGLAQ